MNSLLLTALTQFSIPPFSLLAFSSPLGDREKVSGTDGGKGERARGETESAYAIKHPNGDICLHLLPQIIPLMPTWNRKGVGWRCQELQSRDNVA